MTSDADALDHCFRDAVAAIDAGDVPLLERLITSEPRLVSERIETPGDWLRQQVGDAIDGFFARPYLLWFVAEDPARNARVPSNCVLVIRTIVDAARKQHVVSLQEQLDYTLRLVCWSGVAAKGGVQLEMIDALVEAGASHAEEADTPLANGHFAAAERLLAHGARVTLAAAVCLERWDDVDRVLPQANPEQRQYALVLAALNGRPRAVERMILAGADVNLPSESLYSHGTPLHHAVWSGSLDAVTALVRVGARVDALDSAWDGTPLGWAEHGMDGSTTTDARDRYSAIASYLRSLPAHRDPS